MSSNSGQTGSNGKSHLLEGEEPLQCEKCGENYTSEEATHIQLECVKCNCKLVRVFPCVSEYVHQSEYKQEKIYKQEVIPKVERESDDEMSEENEEMYNLISNVNVTINEKIVKNSEVKLCPSDQNGTSISDLEMVEPKIEPSDEENNLLSAEVPSGFGDMKLFMESNNISLKNIDEVIPSLQGTENQCHLCLKVFSKRSALTCHIRDVHEKSGDFVCGFCGKRFYRNSAKIVHERKHTGEKPFVCDECGKSFDRKSYLNIHSQMHGERYPCDICQKTFSLKKNLAKHIKFVHEKVMNFCCEICSKTFGRKEHLTRHIKDIHEENDVGYVHQCEKCPSNFKKEDSLKLHIRFVHENEKNFFCETCAKSFPRKASLDRHIADVHEQSGSHVCSFCGKKFYKFHAKKIHERSHTNEKPFACSFCDKKYHRSLDKDAHERKHTGDKPFGCEFCDKKFYKAIYLKDHERKHTGEKPFQCESCGESFASKYRKLKHMKSHEEIPEYPRTDHNPSILQPDAYYPPLPGIQPPYSMMNNLPSTNQ